MSTVVAYKERKTRHSHRSSDDDPILAFRKEMAAILYVLVDRNETLGNFDEKEAAHLDGLITNAHDAGHFQVAFTDLFGILQNKATKGKLKDGEGLSTLVEEAKANLSATAKRYKDLFDANLMGIIDKMAHTVNVPPPPANVPPPPANAPSQQYIPNSSRSKSTKVAQLRKKIEASTGSTMCECDERTKAHGENFCTPCLRNRSRRAKSVLNKQTNALKKATLRRQQEAIARRKQVDQLRAQQVELAEAQAELDEVDAEINNNNR